MWVDAAEIVKQNPPSEAELRQGMEYLKRGAKARFYADENFPFIATRILRRLGAQVETVQEAALCGHPDEDHAAYALRNGYVLVTCDRDYLDNRRFPLIHCPAIAVFDFGGGSVSEITCGISLPQASFQDSAVLRQVDQDRCREGFVDHQLAIPQRHDRPQPLPLAPG